MPYCLRKNLIRDLIKNSPTEEVTSICLQLHILLVDDAILEAETLAGWRLYVTNAPTTKLILPQAVMYYRSPYPCNTPLINFTFAMYYMVSLQSDPESGFFVAQ